jgi:hypothetical protein
MALVNAAVWLCAVCTTGDAVLPPRDEVHQSWTHRIAAASQLLFVLGALSWNSVRYGCYVLGSVLVVCALSHYIAPLVFVEHIHAPVERTKLYWVLGVALITLFNHIIMLLSHSFTGPLSLAGAVAAYIVMHTLSLAFMVYSHRRLEPGSFQLMSDPQPASNGDGRPSPPLVPSASGSGAKRFDLGDE